jgi:hypothetical protein
MLRFITAGAGGVVVTVLEQDLADASDGHRVIVGAIAAVPFGLVYWWLDRRSRRPAETPAAPRPAYQFGQPARRR